MERQRQHRSRVMTVEPGSLPLARRNVKKSLKIFLCVTIPLTIATSIIIVANPTSHRAQITGM